MKPRHVVLPALILISVFWLASSRIVNNVKEHAISIASPEPALKQSIAAKKLQEHADQALAFNKLKGFNEELCFLVDMSLPSGQYRFFVYDLNQHIILHSGLVAHGRCNKYWLEGRQYGNTVGCGCTSLGKYKIGGAYQGRFGEAFKLHGLENTNDKAFQRFVVLHSYECVPDAEISEDICQSDGCPMLSPSFLNQLKPIIKKSTKPVMLWIYE